MIKEFSVPMLMNRLPVFGAIKASGVSLYGAAVGEAELDPVEKFQAEQWLSDLEDARVKVGVSSWLP